jgi:hypothetical protein
MPDRLLATRMIHAAEAVVGPLTKLERAMLLDEHDEFDHLGFAEVLDLADFND